jgi:hypothetical protein
MNAVQKGEMTQLEFDTYMNSPHYSINFKWRLAGFPPPPQTKESDVDAKYGPDSRQQLNELLANQGYNKALHIRSGQDHALKAKEIVASYIASHLDVTDASPDFEIYVVWFNFVLGNWKALVSTSLPDGMYYEVTHNGAKGETYLDAYKKFQNICIKE